MQDPESPNESPGLPFQEIFIAIFKHKWKILFFGLLGLIAAGAAYRHLPPTYESTAKLLVKYVVDHTLIDQEVGAARGASQGMNAIIASEVELLTSEDLAREVAKQERLVERKFAADLTEATRRIRMGLTVTPKKETNIIIATYKDRNPELAPAVLTRLIEVYLAKHLKLHRPGDPAKAAIQSQEITEHLKATEETLNARKVEAGIISLDQGAASLTAELSKTQDQLRTAQAELEEQKAKVESLRGTADSPAPATTRRALAADPASESADPDSAPAGDEAPAVATASTVDIENYQVLSGQSARLRQKHLDLLGKFKPESPEVVTIRSQIQDIESQRKALITRFPDLVARVPDLGFGGPSARPFDLGFEQARMAGLQAKVAVLTNQLNEVKDRFNKYSTTASDINNLERQKILEEETAKYAAARVERAKVDAKMNPKNIDYIAELQSPSTAARVTSSRKKTVFSLAGAGFAFGFGLALLLELLFNRTLKRPLELETRLDIPLMLAIPWISRNGRRRLQSGQGPNGNGRSPGTAVARARTAPWEFSHFIRPFAEVVRDRLAMFFEFNGLHHKPKLVGVAGFSAGAGASTLAGGLAAALSETGDGKVLLVDMNLGQTQAHSFFKGQAAYSLTTAIQSPGRMDSAADNLYLATVNPENDSPIPVGLRKFHAMMPGLKASGYDYIIFDMPHLSQTSPTMAMAAYMDKMLLVVAAETSDRNVVKRRYSELLACKARLSVIFNKARHYGPKWLECET